MQINQNPDFGMHNTSARYGKIEYIVIHYVGATGGAKANVNYYNQRNVTHASADFFVGHAGEIWQYNPEPEKRYCWAVGGGRQSDYGGSFYKIATNANTVHIEMCVRSKSSVLIANKDWILEQETLESTIALTRHLMHLYGIDAAHVIRHYDVNGKMCPGIYGWNAASGSEEEWEKFKRRISGAEDREDEKNEPKEQIWYRVRSSWDDPNSQVGAFRSFIFAQSCAERNPGTFVFDNDGKKVYPPDVVDVLFAVRVSIPDLNVRSGPGTDHDIVMTCPVGTYSIVETQEGIGSDSGWGKLLSGVGWISLDFAERI